MEIYETYNDDLYNTADDIKSTYILPYTECVYETMKIGSNKFLFQDILNFYQSVIWILILRACKT